MQNKTLIYTCDGSQKRKLWLKVTSHDLVGFQGIHAKSQKLCGLYLENIPRNILDLAGEFNM